MIVFKFTISSEICEKVEKYLHKKYDSCHTFIYPMFDDEILFVAESHDDCANVTDYVKALCEYEEKEMKYEILKS